VPVWVRAFAEHFGVFFFCPLWVIQLMGSVKMFFASYKKHSKFIGTNIPLWFAIFVSN
jgi:hypothetical protein